MSDSMLLKTLKVLSEAGALDLTAIMGVQMPGGRRPPMVSIQQAFGLPGGGSLPSLGSASNPVKDTGMLLEAIEHAAAFFREKAPHLIKQEGG